MCGIFGWYCWGEVRPNVDLLPNLFLANESRGRDSAGFAYRSSAGISILKNPGPATEFVRSLGPEDWTAAASSRIVIGHTRAQTKGKAADNNNNHPVHFKTWAVVHNGQIHNDDALFEKLGEPRFAEVDTAAIPLVLAGGTSTQSSLARLGLLGGTGTIAAWNSNTPDTLYLARIGFNDVYLFYDAPRQMVVFSSVPGIRRLVSPLSIGGLELSTGSVLPEDSALVLEPTFEDCGWFGIKRQPFYAPSPIRKWLQGPNGATTSEPKIDKFRWTNTNANSRFKKLRPPDFHECHPLSFSNYDLAEASVLSRAPLVGGRAPVIATPYGRWVYTTDPEFPDFVFYPHKSVKRFHEINKLPEWWKRHENLDAVKECDGQLCWEPITTAEKAEDQYVLVAGFVCPWCGVMYKTDIARDNLWTCEWCLITSKPFGANQ